MQRRKFSREFKRFFGRTPAHEAAEMRNALIQLPARAPPQRMAMQ